jgi:hypothetical protein
MITFTDILHKVQERVGPEIPANQINALYRYYPCITSEIEETEARYLDKYEKGIPVCFHLESYGHGVELLKALHQHYTGRIPEGLDRKLPLEDHGKLYLFLYLQEIKDID